MKILYFTTFDLTLSKGPSINEREFVGHLLHHPGIKARAIIPTRGMQLDEFPKEKVRTIRHAWGRSIPSIIASEYEVEQAINSEVREFMPDVVVGRLALLPFGCMRALRYSSTPFAIKTLGSAGFVTKGWNSTQIATRFLRPLVRLILRRVVRKACVIDSTTNELRHLLVKQVGASPDSIFVIPNATNTARFRPLDCSEMKELLAIPREAVVLGYVGGAPLERGGREVIQIVARLRTEGIDAHGLVVGGVASDVLQVARQYQIAAQLHAPGWVEYGAVPGWVNLIDIGIALDNSKRAARIGNSYQKVRQFIACGRFIVTQVGDYDPIVKCPLVIQPTRKDNDEVYSAIRKVLALSTDERESRRIAGRAFAERYLSLTAALEARIELWKSCVALKSPDNCSSS